MPVKDKSTKCKSDRLNPVLLAKLQKLCRVRWCNHFIPDSDTGRAMLVALLRFGLTAESATESAPWCEAGELATLKRRARRIKWRFVADKPPQWVCESPDLKSRWRVKWQLDHESKCEVGKLIDLTFKEWKRAKLFMLRPVDATESDIDAWREEQRKESARKRQAKRREKQKAERENMLAKGQPTTPRQNAILEIIIRKHLRSWFSHTTSVPELMKEAKKLPAFAGVKNLRDAVHETLNQLEKKHAIKTHCVRPVREVMLNLRTDAKPTSEASDSGVGLSDPTIEQKSGKINGLSENSGCHAPIEDMGSVTTVFSPAAPSKPQVSNGFPGTANVIPFPRRGAVPARRGAGASCARRAIGTSRTFWTVGGLPAVPSFFQLKGFFHDHH